jgi:hypothetical protein
MDHLTNRRFTITSQSRSNGRGAGGAAALSIIC